VRQVGHLPELYEDARSNRYKIRSFLCPCCEHTHRGVDAYFQLFLISESNRMSDQLHAHAVLIRGKQLPSSQYPLFRGLGGPQKSFASFAADKVPPLQGIESRSVQPIALSVFGPTLQFGILGIRCTSAEEGTVTFGFWFRVQVAEIPSRSIRNLQKLQ
jgi:hypothetical protein